MNCADRSAGADSGLVTVDGLHSLFHSRARRDEASIYVFRFTVREKDKRPIALHQAAWFSKQAKEAFREMAARARKS